MAEVQQQFDGLTLTSGDLTLNTGNVAVTKGNITATAGNLTVTAGTAKMFVWISSINTTGAWVALAPFAG